MSHYFDLLPGCTALHMAASAGDVRCVKYLIEKVAMLNTPFT